MVKLSVIIPVYNDEKYLRECLDSVCNQTLDDIEIICINDGSTDSSPEILNEYSQADERIIIINQENRGPAASRNNGLDIAKGEYIAFLDADDMYIDCEGLDVMYESAVRNGCEVVSANLKFITSKRRIIHNPHYDKGTFHYFDEDCEITPDEYGIPFYFYKNIYKRELIRDIRFPELSRGEDPIFLSEVLGRVKSVHGVGVDFYGYMVPSTFDKLDSYAKKHDYVSHYRKCFDLLKASQLTMTLEKYVNNLMMYLKGNASGELYEIVSEVFHDDMGYFKGYESQFNEFRITSLLMNVLDTNTNERFLEVKNELSDDVFNEELEILKRSNDLSEYKVKYFKYRLDSGKKRYGELVKENEELKNDLKKEKRFNEEVLNSRSWKLMNRIRKMRG